MAFDHYTNELYLVQITFILISSLLFLLLDNRTQLKEKELILVNLSNNKSDQFDSPPKLPKKL